VSPLWSDMALARAAWANASERGLVDQLPERQQAEIKFEQSRRIVRRPIRRPLSSFAL